MPQSMTGFGRASIEFQGNALSVEAKSYNNRFLKVTLRLPDALSSQEIELENFLRSRLTRGSVYCTFTLSQDLGEGAYKLNLALARKYYGELAALARELRTQEPRVAEVARLDGVVEKAEKDGVGDEALTEAAKATLGKAIDELIVMRAREGEALCKDMTARVKQVEKVAAEIEKRAPKIVSEYRDKLKQRLDQLLKGTGVSLDEAAVVKEVALFADRCDITEETTRLRHHCKQFLQEMGGKEAVGRKLDFIAQEMLRESNTIGSKANDAELASAVVDLKSEIERIKEQVQNLE